MSHRVFNCVFHCARVFHHVFCRVSDCRVFHRVFHLVDVKLNALGDLGHMLEAFGRALVFLKASWGCKYSVLVYTFNSSCVSTPRQCMRTRGY